jgi:hypothetical protein
MEVGALFRPAHGRFEFEFKSQQEGGGWGVEGESMKERLKGVPNPVRVVEKNNTRTYVGLTFGGLTLITLVYS